MPIKCSHRIEMMLAITFALGNRFKVIRSSFLVSWRSLLFVCVVWVELRTCRGSVGVHASEAQFWGSSGQMPTVPIGPTILGSSP